MSSPEPRPETLQLLSRIILLSDPARLTGEAYLDFGSFSPRISLTPPEGVSLSDVASRFFDLLDKLAPELDSEVISARPDRYGFVAHLDLTAASSHERMAAHEQLREMLAKAGFPESEAGPS